VSQYCVESCRSCLWTSLTTSSCPAESLTRCGEGNIAFMLRVSLGVRYHISVSGTGCMISCNICGRQSTYRLCRQLHLFPIQVTAETGVECNDTQIGWLHNHPQWFPSHELKPARVEYLAGCLYKISYLWLLELKSGGLTWDGPICHRVSTFLHKHRQRQLS
jgi:hypothetical protein